MCFIPSNLIDMGISSLFGGSSEFFKVSVLSHNKALNATLVVLDGISHQMESISLISNKIRSQK